MWSVKVLGLLLVFVVQFVEPRHHVMKFNRSLFPGELTLEDLFLDPAADRVADKISASLRVIFSESLTQEIMANVSEPCNAALELQISAWTSLNDCNGDRACSRKYRWVRKVLDSQGRRPNGIESGNRYWIGSYQQCLELKNLDVGNDTIVSYRYCQASIERRAMDQILMGICAPASCSAQDLQSMISRLSKTDRFSIDCHEAPEITRDASAMTALCFFCTFAILLAVATSYDFVLLRSYMNSAKEFPTWKLILRRGLHKTEIANSTSTKLLLTFSLLSNGAKVFTTKRTLDQIDCLHGMRVLSLFWIIMHHCLMILEALDNPTYPWTYPTFAKPVVSCGQIAVDTFFVISGISLSFNWFKEISRPNGEQQLKSIAYWCRYYCYRYIRLTPPYALILWFYSELTQYTWSGPFWPKESHYCKDNWWHNLLYINNYMDAKCMLWTWYLAADFQLYAVAPLVLLAVYYFPTFAFIVSSSLIGLGIIARGFVWALNDLTPNLFSGVMSYDLTHGFVRTLHSAYMHTHLRYNPYLIGLLMGRVLLNSDKKKQQRPRRCWCKFIIWTLAIVFVFGYIYLPFVVDPFPPVVNGVYSGVSRTLWALFIAVVVYECVNGNAELINKFLSSKYWLPLSRMSYCAFLIHGIVYYMMRDGVSTPHHGESMLSAVQWFLTCLVVTLLISCLATTAFEMPALELNKLFVKRPTTARLVVFRKVDQQVVHS